MSGVFINSFMISDLTIFLMLQVNNNGHLTFNQASSVYIPYTFPANGSQDIIAGLWTDLDNRQRGFVSYHQYTSGNVLTRATQDINTYFPNMNFTASWIFVATWNKVAYYSLTSTVRLVLPFIRYSIQIQNISLTWLIPRERKWQR